MTLETSKKLLKITGILFVISSIISIGFGAFEDCDGLESISLPFIGSDYNILSRYDVLLHLIQYPYDYAAPGHP